MRIIRTIIFILVCVGLIWLFIALMTRAFRGGNNTAVVEPTALTTYARTNTEAEVFMSGPIVQNQEHEAVRITVDRTQSRVEILRGYDGQVINQRAFPNTESSYEEFLAALDKMNFSLALTDTTERNEQGACPTGSRYVYTLEDGADLIGRGWTTTCEAGTFGETRSQIKALFVRQIPLKDYQEMTRGMRVR